MLLTGENEDAESITKLYDGVNANYNMAVHPHLERIQK